LQAGAQKITGPTRSESTLIVIVEMVLQHGWSITIDLFAADCNMLCSALNLAIHLLAKWPGAYSGQTEPRQ
jgi:hypothetical protein